MRGKTWTLVNDNRNIRQRAFYYTHVAADPVAKDTVYLLNVSGYRSTDGGKTLTNIGQGTHGDHHDLWIDPDNPKHLVIGNDGGGAVSTEAGQGWTAQDFPTAQYYHVATTAHIPYHLCGAQQDGSTVCIASDRRLAGRCADRAARRAAAQPATEIRQPRPVGAVAVAAAAVAAVDAAAARRRCTAPAVPRTARSRRIPKDVDVIFAGGNNGTFLTRLNRKTGEQREVSPYPRIFSGEPSSAVKERWQWNTPLIFSPVDPNVLYTSSQHVWKTTNAGADAGRRSAATSPGTIRRRWGHRADRSPAT